MWISPGVYGGQFTGVKVAPVAPEASKAVRQRNSPAMRGNSIDSGLNTAQRDAVETLQGPMLVLAGAGTGKTRVVTSRIARLISSGIEPGRILAVTFTNKAAEELQRRVSELLGRKVVGRPHSSTFHSYCVSVLRRHIPRLGYPAKFAIYSTAPQRTLIQRVLREAKLPGAALAPDDLLRRISQWKSKSILPTDALAEAGNDKEHLAAIGYRRYQEALRGLGAVDFDDLLLLTQELFQKHSATRKEEAGRFDHILVDEYQDTNASQYRIVKWLAAGHRNLCVVGDDDQSIYSWRGAEVRHILGFRKDWPDARLIRLEENYRSTASILELANRLIRFNRTRHPKQLKPTGQAGAPPRVIVHADEETEAVDTVFEIAETLRQGKLRPRDVAILFRTNEQPRPFEVELRKLRVPYVLVGGTSFFDRKEVQDVLAYLRLLIDPRDDVALLRILNRPPRGIGKETVATLRSAAKKSGQPLWHAVSQMASGLGLGAGPQRGCAALTETLDRHRDAATRTPPSKVVRSLLNDVDYHREVVATYAKEDHQRQHWSLVGQILDDLQQRERRMPKLALDEYLHDLALRGRDFETKSKKDEQLERDAVVLMTLHAAKGLEFPVVYLVGMEEGLLPHRRSVTLDDASIEEERRLCYVGVTRARERLTLSLAKTRRKRGRDVPSHPSRFLYELTGQEAHPDYAAAQK